MNCLKCNRNIPDDARWCPYCSTVILPQQLNKDRVIKKAYDKTLTSLKEFITKAPIDVNKAKVLDWQSNFINTKPKRSKFFLPLVVIIIMTGFLILIFAASGQFK